MIEFSPGLPGDLRSQRYRDYQRQRQYQTNDILLENRIIFFGLRRRHLLRPGDQRHHGQRRDPADALPPVREP